MFQEMPQYFKFNFQYDKINNITSAYFDFSLIGLRSALVLFRWSDLGVYENSPAGDEIPQHFSL